MAPSLRGSRSIFSPRWRASRWRSTECPHGGRLLTLRSSGPGLPGEFRDGFPSPPQFPVMKGPSAASLSSAFAAEKPDFAELFEREFEYVWFTLRRFGVSTRDLEDVTHDVFIQVYKHLDRYDPQRPLRPWLFAF